MEGEGTDSDVEGAEMVREERTVAEKCYSQRRIRCLRIRRIHPHPYDARSSYSIVLSDIKMLSHKLLIGIWSFEDAIKAGERMK